MAFHKEEHPYTSSNRRGFCPHMNRYTTTQAAFQVLHKSLSRYPAHTAVLHTWRRHFLRTTGPFQCKRRDGQLFAVAARKRRMMAQSSWVSTNHGRPRWSSWLPVGPALIVVTTWRMKQQMEDLSLFLPLK